MRTHLRAAFIGLAFAASLLITLGPALAQNQPPVVVMTPGSYYDPAGCAGVAFAGGLYLCQAQPTATPTATPVPPTATPISRQVPIAGQTCPQWVHDQYVTTGPDGKTYPTWHPPIDPQYGCLFGHEHGADPRTAKANSSLPAFGYAAATIGMVEPHEGYKVFVMNAGDTVESNVPSKIADDSTRLVFHQGTSGVGRMSQEFHSFQLDYIDASGSGKTAHLYGLADTGQAVLDGSTCDTPRKGAKDFSTIGCNDTYEIWPVKFQILDPADPYTGIDQSRFGMIPSVATFDPITTRDPLDLSHLVYTEAAQPQRDPTSYTGDPLSPNAFFQGCRREFYSGPLYFNNPGPTSYWTDAYGRVSLSGQDAQHPILQQVSASVGMKLANYKLRADYCGNGIHAPN